MYGWCVFILIWLQSFFKTNIMRQLFGKKERGSLGKCFYYFFHPVFSCTFGIFGVAISLLALAWSGLCVCASCLCVCLSVCLLSLYFLLCVSAFPSLSPFLPSHSLPLPFPPSCLSLSISTCLSLSPGASHPYCPWSPRPPLPSRKGSLQESKSCSGRIKKTVPRKISLIRN